MMTYRLERWWKRYPRCWDWANVHEWVQAFAGYDPVKGVYMAYRGRAWPRFWRAKIEVLDHASS